MPRNALLALTVTMHRRPGPTVSGFVQRFGQREGLSARETAVLTLAALGIHRKEAASRLGCSAGTVDTYWRRIFKKTRSSSQAEIFALLLASALDETTKGVPDDDSCAAERRPG